MKIWTLQPVEILEEIENTGKFICNENKSKHLKDQNFKRAYDWLITKMEEKIGYRPNCVKYPIWAWHTTNWKNIQPDLSSNVFRDYKERKMVCLELEIPDKEVVLTDEPLWTAFILNNDFLNVETEETAWDEKEEWFENLSYDEKEPIKIASWDNVFDVTPFENEFCTQGKYVQATFWEIRKEYIKKITHFVS